MSRFVWAQALYDLAQGSQGQVDAFWFFEIFPIISGDACFSMPFTACQVYQVQFAFSVMFMAIGIGVNDFDPYCEDGMRSISIFYVSW